MGAGSYQNELQTLKQDRISGKWLMGSFVVAAQRPGKIYCQGA